MLSKRLYLRLRLQFRASCVKQVPDVEGHCTLCTGLSLGRVFGYGRIRGNLDSGVLRILDSRGQKCSAWCTCGYSGVYVGDDSRVSEVSKRPLVFSVPADSVGGAAARVGGAVVGWGRVYSYGSGLLGGSRWPVSVGRWGYFSEVVLELEGRLVSSRILGSGGAFALRGCVVGCR